MAGGIGIVARTPEELKQATIKGFQARVPVIVNVIVDPQADLPMVSLFSILPGRVPRWWYLPIVQGSRSVGLLMARHGQERGKGGQALSVEKAYDILARWRANQARLQ